VDAVYPFQGSPEEQKDLRNIFRVVSSGGNPYGYPETENTYKKYKTIFDIFEVCVDSRYGNLIHLPFNGGVVDQGAKTMGLLKYLQSLFRQKIMEEEKKKSKF
jgi:hypothetical protein